MSKLQGISPRLPLVYNSTDGPYQLNKVLTDAMRQNLKMLILTAPGERIMIPEFGVGLHRYLFEQMTSSTFSTVSQKINEQVERYIPAINLEEVMFVTSDEDPSLGLNDVRTVIKYNILPFAGTDQLIITTTMTN
jgi:phage baseplate assembly protein W